MRRNPKKGGQFAIIWVDLLYEDSVPATAKILFGEIYRLSGPDGWCDASNQDFMDLLGCSETTVRNLLKALEDEALMLDMNNNISPCVVRPLQGDRFYYLVLPVRLFTGNM